MSKRTKRLAVVIGNSEYKNLTKLPNATSDAGAIQKMLQSLEYEVVYGVNLLRNEMLKFFSDVLDTWEYKAKEIVFYYSGHAIPSDDKVYLVPYDADEIIPEILTKSFLDVDIIIGTLLKKRKNYAVPIIVILNCYRPLIKSIGSNDYYQGRPLRKVSKEIGTNYNIAILYSMAEDEIALDGNVENEHSPFARILLENMEKDWSINQIHSSILRFIEDSDKLRDKQVSWLYQSLFEPYKFCLPKSIVVVPHDHAKDPFHGVPPENQNFVNRSGIFTKIDAIFVGKSGGRRILALQGLGGTGKTQIMLRYCYLHRLEYDFIFWLEIDGRIAALESFRKLAINLDLDVESAKEISADNSIIKWVSTWLEKRTKWLLLLNNVDEEMSIDIFNVLPRFGGNIIMTTRESIPLTKAKIIYVPKMEEDEALSLLYGATPIRSVNPKSIQYQYAKEIISEFDSLPLAIDLARAYVDTMLMSFKDYLKMFRNKRDRVEILLHRDEDNIHQYNHSLATAWKISFDRIKIESPMAAFILDTCSFLNPELIPIGFFENQYLALGHGSELYSSLRSEESDDSWRMVRRAISVLVKFSFVTRILNDDEDKAEDPSRNTLTIHRIVQKVIYDSMTNEQKIRWTHNLANALKNEINISDYSSRLTQTIMKAYLLHIRHFVKMLDINQKAFMSQDLCDLMLMTIKYLVDNGVYFGVEELAQLTLSISISIENPESSSVGMALYLMANLYFYQGNYAKAEPLYKQALVTFEVLGPENIMYAAMCMDNFATLQKHLGNYAEAEQMYKQVLAIREEILGAEHPSTATTLNNLALLYENLGNYAKAVPLYERALVIREMTLGPEHAETATFLNNLALLYNNSRNFAKAEPLFKRVLDIREKALGLEHPFTAKSLNNLASIYHHQQKDAKAEPLYERALMIRENVLGPEHPETAASLSDVAWFHENCGNYAKAEPLYERALIIREKVFGPEHLETAMSLYDLATFYKKRENYAKAEQLHKRALVIRQKALGPEHLEVAVSLKGLALLCKIQGNYVKAESLYLQALMIREKALGPKSQFTGQSLSDLAALYNKQGNYSKAKPLYERALAIYEEVHGPEHEFVAMLRKKLTTVQENLATLPTNNTLIQTATNLQTLAKIFNTQRAVVVFFTSATCGSCQAIELEFERILQDASSGGQSKVVGVKVDTEVAFDAARMYDIKATPTFVFFLDDKKFHNFQGADQAELKSSFDLLIFTAYPLHPHRTILLRHIPDLPTAPILFVKSGLMGPIFNKLDTFVEQARLSLSEDEKALLNRVQSGLEKNEKLQEDIVNGDQWNELLLKFLNTLPPENQFPILDIFRLLLIREKSNLGDYYANKYDTIVHIIDQSNKIAESPQSLTLMNLRIACNTFGFPSISLFENPPRTSLTALLIKAFLSPDTQTRLTAACLAFNVSATIASQRHQSETSNLQLPIEDDDWELEIAWAVVVAIEKEQDEETLHRLVGSLAHLIFLCPRSSEVPELVIALGLEETLNDKQKNVKVKALCDEIRKIARKSAE